MNDTTFVNNESPGYQPYMINGVPISSDPLPPEFTSVPAQADPGKNAAVASLVLGILSIVFGLGLVGLGCSVAGIIAYETSKKACLEARKPPSGIAKAGRVCSVVGLALSCVFLIIKAIIIFLPAIVGIMAI